MKLLITGGTVFVSRYTAMYFSRLGHDVYVLNRGSRPQPQGVTALVGDRHRAADLLRGHTFDAVLDITAYTAQDVTDLLDALGSFGQYILLSSSAVYPETLPQPFAETAPTGENCFWGAYGTNKIAAEQALLARCPTAYILRPPYLYGAMNNLYREAFVFDCAEADRPFYLPGDGSLPLQLFDIEDLCRLTALLLQRRPAGNLFNVGNPQTVSVRQWVTACYAVLGKTPHFCEVTKDMPQRSYFPFTDYAYALDVQRQQTLLPEVKPLAGGLAQSWEWYRANRSEVRRKPLLEFIDTQLG